MNLYENIWSSIWNSDTIKWIKVDKESDIKKGLNDNKYYGAAIFNKDFSKNAMSKTQKVMIDSKKAEMKEKVESGEIPAAAVQQMQKKKLDKLQTFIKPTSKHYVWSSAKSRRPTCRLTVGARNLHFIQTHSLHPFGCVQII